MALSLACTHKILTKREQQQLKKREKVVELSNHVIDELTARMSLTENSTDYVHIQQVTNVFRAKLIRDLKISQRALM